MATKRTKDPSGLLPDHVSIDPDDDSMEAKVAWVETINASTPHARVKRLQNHPHAGMKEHANELNARLMTEIGLPLPNGLHLPRGVHQINGEDIPELMSAIAEAETAAMHLTVSPIVMRDISRQAGTKKERRPEITDWIIEKLSKNPGAKCPDLWSTAPDWITEQIGPDRFKKRVAAARKKRAASN
jgi:hypothetical protein